MIIQMDLSDAASDVDKAHRIGAMIDNKQSVIVRFKSHSRRYEVYNNKKKCWRGLKINPSLTPKRLQLLKRIDNSIDEKSPFDFVMGNVHGDLLVKSKVSILGTSFHPVYCFEDFQDLKTKIHAYDTGGLDENDEQLLANPTGPLASEF